MNRSSMKEEEEEEEVANAETERTATFYLWHPCSFLEEALSAFLRCLGVETGTRKGSNSMKKEEQSPLLKHDSDHADPDHIITPPQNSASNSQKSYQVAADPPSTTSTQIINESATERRGPRRPPLRQGSGGQHN